MCIKWYLNENESNIITEQDELMVWLFAFNKCLELLDECDKEM